MELCAAAVEQQKITELRLRRVFAGAAAAGERRAGQILSHIAGSRPGAWLALDAQLHPSAAPALPPTHPPPHARASQPAGPAAAAPALALRSPITTHVLDTSVGRPAAGVRVSLHRLAPGSADGWERVAAGSTNRDGRIGDLLPPAASVPAGTYRISFDTDEYMERCRAAHPGFFASRPFYPAVDVHFEITPQQVRGGGGCMQGGCRRGSRARDRCALTNRTTCVVCRRSSTSTCR